MHYAFNDHYDEADKKKKTIMFFYPYFKRQVATHPQIYLILNKDFFWRLLVFTSVFLPFSLLWLSILKSYPILVFMWRQLWLLKIS